MSCATRFVSLLHSPTGESVGGWAASVATSRYKQILSGYLFIYLFISLFYSLFNDAVNS
jgi:hypothetical protein